MAKGILGEFAAFIKKYGVIGLALGVVMGTAVTQLVGSLVENLINPILGLILGGGANFPALNFELAKATPDREAVVFGLGSFLGALINFLVIAFVIFILIKQVNKIFGEDETKKV